MSFSPGRPVPKRSRLPKSSILDSPRHLPGAIFMFHVEHETLQRIGEFLRIQITETQIELLTRYRDWLRDEAVPAGGLGPRELNRLERRHLADSLLFAAGFDGDPTRVRDLGSGVGLPGIPLAIVFPHSEFELIDRSGRRVDLARRALRVLGLENARVIQGEMAHSRVRVPIIVSRASLPAEELRDVAFAQLEKGGIAVVGGSWTARPTLSGWETMEIPSEILDQPVWLLIMRRQ